VSSTFPQVRLLTGGAVARCLRRFRRSEGGGAGGGSPPWGRSLADEKINNYFPRVTCNIEKDHIIYILIL
jgi:hypothetical protein